MPNRQFSFACLVVLSALYCVLHFRRSLTNPVNTTDLLKMSARNPLTLACLSDTQGLHRQNELKVPDADVLVFAGDAGLSSEAEVNSFNHWLGLLPHKHKIMVYGNMDYYTERPDFDHKKLLSNATAILKDSYVEIDGYVFYGTPYTPKFCGGYQLKDQKVAEKHWKKTFENLPKIDVLITHGPPYGCGDETGGRHVGDIALGRNVDTWKDPPELWVCGHVHASHGYHVYHHPNGSLPLINVAVWYLGGEALSEAQPLFVELPSMRIWRNKQLVQPSHL